MSIGDAAMQSASADRSADSGRVSVTVITGFLGSGKTTLLNRILTEKHGKRIAVIEDEFGEVGVDHELVISAEEEIFEMNNGCICCTIRGDLIRILGTLMKRRDRFDAILIETCRRRPPGHGRGAPHRLSDAAGQRPDRRTCNSVANRIQAC